MECKICELAKHTTEGFACQPTETLKGSHRNITHELASNTKHEFAKEYIYGFAVQLQFAYFLGLHQMKLGSHAIQASQTEKSFTQVFTYLYRVR